jgi:hypothetical protein
MEYYTRAGEQEPRQPDWPNKSSEHVVYIFLKAVLTVDRQAQAGTYTAKSYLTIFLGDCIYRIKAL